MTTSLTVALAMQDGLQRRLFSDAAMARLAAVAEVRPGVLHRDLTEVDPALLADVDVLVTGWGAPALTDAALATVPRLRAVVHAAGSVKHHLPDSFWAHRIPVSSAADANSIPVAEFTLAAILFANKAALPLAVAYRKDPLGASGLLDAYPRIGNYGKRVGIVGASRIGRRVIGLLAPFDLEVVVSDPYLGAEDARRLGVTVVTLDELLATSDVVSLHAPALPSTRHMIGRDQLALMRDGATLINTARGALVDHEALVAELGTGRIDAILDHTEPEVLPVDSPLLSLPNVLVTPHIAGSLGTELTRLGDAAVDEVVRIADGGAPVHVVLPEHLDRTA